MIGRDDPRLRDRDGLGRKLAEAAGSAAAVLLSKRAAYEVKLKGDGSPVCTADLAADRAAKDALARLLPGFPVISEETVGDAQPDAVFVLLDPLDGTREFLAGGDSYCVAIAVVVDGRPVAGAIAAPALGRLWYGGEHAFTQGFAADGALLGAPRRVAVRAVPAEGPVVLVSRFHGDGRSEGITAALCKGKGVPMSSAVKFGLIACGEADLHVRCGQTMEWDTAAGDAILSAAGGVILTLDGAVPRYGRADRQFRNPPFVAASSEGLARRAIAGC
ncbi:3'(2'),5'-bisphosphate nucleotidase CysQ family protein [Bosea minatitlanensis]|uniref:3'(2'),5'-bisphosphate nucleotidase CysQ n=1 Tax=Bosea minatitlanensis TaxID=128782 RepID=A0ABW0F294_9HYPH|nr:3'(2'),5'-bisphosphate nucleotidase CysQ [Bosea minatitlanensis]MCT4491748.1 3'(2'),5'-bisphosphate nucleotidase CysQ [Bosea minatitlanensis]